eukprot:CAMPEP_0182926024 /NCGR_PEP_ID=MMETSP0105_2-20130417/10786_1 /TAXON_ID=81532 ORGANISM="Acanthoeca-like sp., Strain 10tr" /NCGR_SAMPLE_ID=MMETSP0105_2 /ASSEMBLY_ACC=CAM_ASM_000205 /LENGTH=110 /DNA_ID=CAMNT_0025063895 /DNA_START=20 /DNA_END=352 /DNA_ORIENTATION=-
MAHRSGVMTLYRRSLQHARSWAIETDLYRAWGASIRERFDANKGEHNFIKATALLKAGEAELTKHAHPDKYKPCTALDGTKWERNVPPPPEVLVMTPAEEALYNDKANWS